MTPQQLIDLPYAGMAEKQLRKQGYWRHCVTDKERVDWLAENVTSMKRLEEKQVWKFKTEYDDYDPDFFREDIDNAASMEALT